MSDDFLIQLTAHIVSSHVSNNPVTSGQVSGLIENVFTALKDAARPVAIEATKLEPAVSIRASVKPDYIVCLEDGAKFMTMKRHLAEAHGLTPEEYRAKWGLPADYPIVAPNYSEKRRALSLEIGLGRKKAAKPARAPRSAVKARGNGKGEVAASPAPKEAQAPTRKPRSKRSTASAAE